MCVILFYFSFILRLTLFFLASLYWYFVFFLSSFCHFKSSDVNMPYIELYVNMYICNFDEMQECNSLSVYRFEFWRRWRWAPSVLMHAVCMRPCVWVNVLQNGILKILWTILRLSSYIMHVYKLRAVHELNPLQREREHRTVHMFYAHSVQFLFADRQTKTRIRERRKRRHTAEKKTICITYRETERHRHRQSHSHSHIQMARGAHENTHEIRMEVLSVIS